MSDEDAYYKDDYKTDIEMHKENQLVPRREAVRDPTIAAHHIFYMFQTHDAVCETRKKNVCPTDYGKDSCSFGSYICLIAQWV